MASSLIDIDFIVTGELCTPLDLYSLLKLRFRATLAGYYRFDEMYNDELMILHDSGASVTKAPSGYHGRFSFVNVTLENLRTPLCIKFTGSKEYLGVGAADSKRVLNKNWSYDSPDSESAFITGWDTWIIPYSYQNHAISLGKNKLRFNDTIPVKISYDGANMRVEAGERCLLLAVPKSHRPCVVMFNPEIMATIISTEEYDKMSKGFKRPKRSQPVINGEFQKEKKKGVFSRIRNLFT
jgi:hypothetical protein